MWIIVTEDDRVAVRKATAKTYSLGPNTPRTRKEWKTERGAREALRRIGLINSIGAKALCVRPAQVPPMIRAGFFPTSI